MLKFLKSKIILVVILAAAVNLYTHRRELVNPYVVEPDITANYIMYFRDASLFNNDIFCQYVRHIFPFEAFSHDFPKNFLFSVFLSYYLLLSYFFNALSYLVKMFTLPQFSALISCLYSIIAAVFVFKIGRLFSRKDSDSFCLVFFFLIYSATMDSFSGGLNRGLGFIITCASYYYLCKLQLRNIFLCILLSVFCDLHILIMLISAFILAAFKKYFKKSYKGEGILYLGALFSLIVFVIFLSGIAKQGFCRAFLENHMEWKWFLKSDPGENTFIGFLSNFILNIHEHSVMYKYLTLFLLAANCFLIFFRSTSPLLTQGELIFICSFLFSFIMLLPFHFGIASRQLVFSLPLFIIILFWKQIIYKIHRKQKVMVLLVFLLGFVFVIFNKYSNELADFSRRKTYFEYVSSLPKDILIAGHPDDLRYVPFFCKRSVYFDALWEQIGNFFDNGTGKIIKERKYRLLTVLYENNLDNFVDFAVSNNITHISIDEYYYSNEYLFGALKWDQAFKEEILKLLPAQKGKYREFAVLEAARKFGKSMDEGVYILDCRDIKSDAKKND